MHPIAHPPLHPSCHHKIVFAKFNLTIFLLHLSNDWFCIVIKQLLTVLNESLNLFIIKQVPDFNKTITCNGKDFPWTNKQIRALTAERKRHFT